MGPGRNFPPPASRAQWPTLLSLWAVSLGGENCLCGLEQETFFCFFFNAQMLGEGCGTRSWQGTGEERWPLPTLRMPKVEDHHQRRNWGAVRVPQQDSSQLCETRKASQRMGWKLPEDQKAQKEAKGFSGVMSKHRREPDHKGQARADPESWGPSRRGTCPKADSGGG